MPPDDLFVLRLGRYFRHPNPGHDVLRPGERSVACENVRSALAYLGVSDNGLQTPDDPLLFDKDLAAAVARFQSAHKHPYSDGNVGPNTRRRLVNELVSRFQGPSIFGRMKRHDPDAKPVVFISYASEDVDKVEKLDQWLSDKGVTVIRDTKAFYAGQTIEDNIRNALTRADTIIAIHSRQSKKKDWPRLELALGEDLERRLGERLLVYVRLDNVNLPAHDTHRLAIAAAPPRTLREVGEDLLFVLYEGYEKGPRRLEIDENDPL
jgi:hypothetical protein